VCACKVLIFWLKFIQIGDAHAMISWYVYITCYIFSTHTHLTSLFVSGEIDKSLMSCDRSNVSNNLGLVDFNDNNRDNVNHDSQINLGQEKDSYRPLLVLNLCCG
jgi:hypothetical protein